MPSLRPTKNADVDNIQNEDQEHEAFLAREDVSAACSAISDYRGWSNTYCYSYDCNVNPEGYPSEYFEKGLDLARDQMVLALDKFSDQDLHRVLELTAQWEEGDICQVMSIEEIRKKAPQSRERFRNEEERKQREQKEYEAFMARRDVKAATTLISNYQGLEKEYEAFWDRPDVKAATTSFSNYQDLEDAQFQEFGKSRALARDQMVLALDNFSDADLHNILLYTSECGPVEFGDYFDQPVANLQEIRDEASLLRENTKKHEGKSADASLNAEVPG